MFRRHGEGGRLGRLICLIGAIVSIEWGMHKFRRPARPSTPRARMGSKRIAVALTGSGGCTPVSEPGPVSVSSVEGPPASAASGGGERRGCRCAGSAPSQLPPPCASADGVEHLMARAASSDNSGAGIRWLGRSLGTRVARCGRQCGPGRGRRHAGPAHRAGAGGLPEEQGTQVKKKHEAPSGQQEPNRGLPLELGVAKGVAQHAARAGPHTPWSATNDECVRASD